MFWLPASGNQRFAEMGVVLCLTMARGVMQNFSGEYQYGPTAKNRGPDGNTTGFVVCSGQGAVPQ